MSIWHRWAAHWRARRARLEQNHALLRRVADELGREFEAKSYQELRDHGAEEFSSDRIVDETPIHYSGEAYRTLANGDLAFCIDVSGLPTKGGTKPSYHFYKRPDGSVYYWGVIRRMQSGPPPILPWIPPPIWVDPVAS